MTHSTRVFSVLFLTWAVQWNQPMVNPSRWNAICYELGGKLFWLRLRCVNCRCSASDTLLVQWNWTWGKMSFPSRTAFVFPSHSEHCWRQRQSTGQGYTCSSHITFYEQLFLISLQDQQQNLHITISAAGQITWHMWHDHWQKPGNSKIRPRPHPWLQPFWEKSSTTRLREETPAQAVDPHKFCWCSSEMGTEDMPRPWGAQHCCHELFARFCKVALMGTERGPQYPLEAKIFCMDALSPHCNSVSPGWRWKPLLGAGEALGTERRCGSLT